MSSTGSTAHQTALRQSVHVCGVVRSGSHAGLCSCTRCMCHTRCLLTGWAAVPEAQMEQLAPTHGTHKSVTATTGTAQ